MGLGVTAMRFLPKIAVIIGIAAFPFVCNSETRDFASQKVDGILGTNARLNEPLTREEIRERVRTGKIRYRNCITDKIVDDGQLTVVFSNSCDVQINVELCERRSIDVSSNHYFMIVAGKSENRYRPRLKSGETFKYTYNTCGVPYCTPPDSDC